MGIFILSIDRSDRKPEMGCEIELSEKNISDLFSLINFKLGSPLLYRSPGLLVDCLSDWNPEWDKSVPLEYEGIRKGLPMNYYIPSDPIQVYLLPADKILDWQKRQFYKKFEYSNTHNCGYPCEPHRIIETDIISYCRDFSKNVSVTYQMGTRSPICLKLGSYSAIKIIREVIEYVKNNDISQIIQPQ